MLSAETAIGDHPIEVVETMSRIAEEAEAAPEEFRVVQLPDDPTGSYPHVVAAAAANVARQLPAKAIVAITRSGFTPLIVSKYRAPSPIVGITCFERVARRLPLLWNVQGQVVVDSSAGLEEILGAVSDLVRHTGLLSAGDTVVLMASASGVQLQGATNLLEVRQL
jgi:pyruvate kinase